MMLYIELWKLHLFVLFFLLRLCYTSASLGHWWNLGFLSWKAHPRIDQGLIVSAQPMCTSIAGLSPKQTQMCQEFFDVMPAVSYGAQLGMHECRSQFKVRRWNCSSPSTGIAFGPAADDATRESSYAHAISAAGVVHAVARACKRANLDMGEISSPLVRRCGCSRVLRPKHLNRDWIWGGCGDDIMYGYNFAKGFIDAKEIEQNHPRFSPSLARTMMNLHNNEVGRRAVFRYAEIGCKCHGVSGSCSLRTCWQQLRSFNKVGSIMMDMYDKAAKVRLSKKGTDIRRVERRRPRKPRKTELVFLESSPDHCVPNSEFGIMGTQGRECSLDVRKPNNCNHMCCRRGYFVRRVREEKRCECKFEWCCQVKCKICKEERQVYICK